MADGYSDTDGMLTWEEACRGQYQGAFGDYGGEVRLVNSSNHSGSPLAFSKVNLKLSLEE